MDETTQRPSGLWGWITDHPLPALAGAAIVVVLVAAFLFNRKNNQSALGAGGQGQAAGDLSGLATDAQGNHIVYVPTADYFNTVNEISGSYNNPVTTTTNSTTTTDTSTTTNPPPTPPPVVPKPPPKSTRGQWIAHHVVVKGETLAKIADSFRDKGLHDVTAASIYSHNKHTIDTTAAMHHAHGMTIFAGEVLSVPSLS